MVLSTSEKAGKVAGWQACFLGWHFGHNPSPIWVFCAGPSLGQKGPPRSIFFVLDPTWAKRALIFIPCECSAACQKLPETGETAQRMFLNTWEVTEEVAGWPG